MLGPASVVLCDAQQPRRPARRRQRWMWLSLYWPKHTPRGEQLNSHQPQDPAIHLLDRFSKLQNNEYEVPFSHYSSANNISTKHPPSSFQPTPAMFSRVTAGFKPYILAQNSGDSLPNILDTKSYIHPNSKKGLNEKIDYDLPLAS